MLSLRFYTVAVHDLESAVDQYQRQFGMDVLGERFRNPVVGTFDMVPMGYDGQLLLYLIQPINEEGALYRLMQDRKNQFNPQGEGVYLIAYECEDPEAFAQKVEKGGGRITRVSNSKTVWVHPTSSNFVLMEIVPPRL